MAKKTKFWESTNILSTGSQRVKIIDWQVLELQTSMKIVQSTIYSCSGTLSTLFLPLRHTSATFLPSVFSISINLPAFFFDPVVLTTGWPHWISGRWSAAIQLSHCPEPSGHVVHEEVNGLDIAGQHHRQFVLLRHTHRLQRRPYPICTSRSRNAQHSCRGS